MHRLLSIVGFITMTVGGWAQLPTQTIRGTITDGASGMPIPYASVVVLNTSPIKGAAADSAGNFTILAVPVGRYDIQVSQMGYDNAVVREVQLTSAKELYLNITLRESTTTLSEVVVKPKVNKNAPLNTMATVSGRMLSVEEASRYAGGFDDPARLAASFAGVASNVNNNSIVIRGNSPKSLQWKLEGIEIPNPNHFADMAAFGGGGLTALSSQLLANSDFFTGAFPAEYNNALSGVFDIYMRNGNNQKYENSFQAGILGIEASSEGPLSNSHRGSYLVNYRYSTLGLISSLLPENAGGVMYQDLSFKLNMPTANAGVFTLWGIGLSDRSGQVAKDDSTEWEYLQDKQESVVLQYMASAGLTHQYFFNNKTYLKSSLATTYDKLDLTTEQMNSQLNLMPENNIQNSNQTFVLTSTLNNKFSARHTNRTGVTVTGIHYNLLLQDTNEPGEVLQTIVNEQGFSTLLSAYTSSAYQLTNQWSVTAGLNSQLFTLNGHYTIEPRLGVKWQMTNNQSLALAYGLHSRLEKLNFYFNNNLATGERAVNKHLDFSKAHHLVLSYDRNIGDNMHLKVEPYIQLLYNVPVIADSSYSFINMQNDWFFDDKLVNEGKSVNYGVDVTFEKYLTQGFYYMVTASLFDSKYMGGDDKWYNTRYNRHYLFNFLMGKEWQTGKNRQNVFGANVRFSLQGGDRYSPVDEAASNRNQDVVFDETRAFEEQLQQSFNTHFTISYRINKTRNSQEIAFKCINATMQDEFTDFSYNYQQNRVDERRDVIFIPNLSYKVEF